ncbi:MAG: uroporphyrinogen decarboxylase/cobalamine-independent methonine synthase family protein [Anaerolineae bacterium]
MSSGLSWKANAADTLARLRRFLTRGMQDGILATLPVAPDQAATAAAWQAFDARWGIRNEDDDRPFPSNEEIYDRMLIGLAERSRVPDDSLPVLYSTLDLGEGMVSAMYASPIRYLHRRHQPAFSFSTPLLAGGYAAMNGLQFSLDGRWPRRLLEINRFFEEHAAGRFAQHPFLTLDALNFAVEMRGATRAYSDIYEFPRELAQLMELGLDFNIRVQEAQAALIPGFQGGSFVWLAGWAPFARAISLSVDAYVVCSVKTYEEFGFEYNRRLVEHFGHGMLHFHCNRADLAQAVAQIPGLELFQYGAGLPSGPADYSFLPAMRRAVGSIPLQVSYPLAEFLEALDARTLPPNVWYMVDHGSLTADEANRVMDRVRAYRA